MRSRAKNKNENKNKARLRPRQRDLPNNLPTTESEAADAVNENGTNELTDSSSSMAAIRRMQDRIPTPGPRPSFDAGTETDLVGPPARLDPVAEVTAAVERRS